MQPAKDVLKRFFKEISGCVRIGDYLIMPFNHWKRDTFWMFLVTCDGEYPLFIPAEAIKIEEAIDEALTYYKELWEIDDES